MKNDSLALRRLVYIIPVHVYVHAFNKYVGNVTSEAQHSHQDEYVHLITIPLEYLVESSTHRKVICTV